jgi:hypothetical protein
MRSASGDDTSPAIEAAISGNRFVALLLGIALQSSLSHLEILSIWIPDWREPWNPPSIVQPKVWRRSVG